MTKKLSTRTVKSKFLIADKIGRGIKTAGKPIIIVGVSLFPLILKKVTPKDETNSGNDD
jgi:hypothetical protein